MKKILLTLLSLLLSVQSILAQEVSDVPEGSESPLQAEAAQVVSGETLMTLDFKDAPLATVMDYISENAGFTIISNTSLTGRVSIISKNPVTVDQALDLINSVLKENEFAVVRTGNILKVVLLSEAKQMNIPVRSGNVPENISPTDEIVTHIIPIKFADAVKLKDDLAGLLPEYADFTANQASNSLIITDTSANVRRISEIVKALDTQMAMVSEVRVYRLVYADAENVANVVNEIFEDTSSSSSQNQNPLSRMFRGPGGPFGAMMGGGRDRGDNNDSSGGNTKASRVIAADDQMTNSVVVSGPTETLDVIGNMIIQLDTNPDDERGLYVYPLKNGDAANVKDLLNNLFSELQSINQNNTSGMGGRAGGFTGNTGNNSSSSGSNDISDQTYIEADSDTNSLVILTSSKNYEKIRPVIEDLDKPVPQVLIKVLIAELTVTNDFDLGMEFSTTRTRNSGDNYTVGSEFIPDTASTGFNANMLIGDFAGRILALQQEGKLNILSRPYILTSNNQTASITVGNSVPFITDSNYTETGQTVNTIEYQDVGIMLQVTPYINPNGLVIMDVAPEISAISDATIDFGNGVKSTIFSKRSSSSKVAVKNGQTVVIGGLMQDDESETIDKVPVLGDIPLLGLLFQRKTTSKGKTELLIFLTPQVAEDADVLQGVSDFEKGKSRLLRESEPDSLLNQHIENMISVAPSDNKDTASQAQDNSDIKPEN
ncbi:MAG: type II secretion system secretin GspD [Sedimentisphaerales bacterium]|nr:type II secretion system secretin GspD [Sedimentisphaerales bacterium]